MLYRSKVNRCNKPIGHVCALSAFISIALTGCGGAGEDGSDTTNEQSTTPMVSVDGASVNEGSRGNTELTLPISLSATPSEDVEITYSFEDVTAVNGEDYAASGGKLTIPAGTRRAEIVLTVQSDDIHEPDETFKVHLESATNADLSTRGKTATVTLRNDDDAPEIAFDMEQQSVSETVGSVIVPVSLSAPSGFEVSASISLSGTALENGDYQLDGDTHLTFAVGETFKEVELAILPDTIPEGGETVFVSLEQPENGVVSSDGNSTHTVVILGDTTLNDTGLTSYSDGVVGDLAFEPSSHPGQDASFGRDADGAQLSTDGHAGFSYTKLDLNGNPLPSSASSWSCVRDNVTGLVWENKQADFTIETTDGDGATVLNTPTGEQWRAGNFVYGWHNEEAANNGGNSGYLRTSDNRLDKDEPVTAEYGYCGFRYSGGRRFDLHCDTAAYIQEMNLQGTCGFDDWRMPEVSELRSLANYDKLDGTMRPEGAFFSNLKSSVSYLSGTPAADNEASAWCYDYQDGEVELCQKSYYQGFMAVRSKQ